MGGRSTGMQKPSNGLVLRSDSVAETWRRSLTRATSGRLLRMGGIPDLGVLDAAPLEAFGRGAASAAVTSPRSHRNMQVESVGVCNQTA